MRRGGIARWAGIRDRVRQLVGHSVVTALAVPSLLVGGTDCAAFRLALRLTVSANAMGVSITNAVSAATAILAIPLFIDLLPLSRRERHPCESRVRRTPGNRSVFHQAIGWECQCDKTAQLFRKVAT